MTQESIKKLKIGLTTVATIIGGLIGVYEAYIHITKSMNETAKKKLEEYTLPIVKYEIKQTVDSIYSHRTYSRSVGLRVIPEEDKIIYRHIDGKEYRPFYDIEQDQYYFIDENNEAKWCK